MHNRLIRAQNLKGDVLVSSSRYSRTLLSIYLTFLFMRLSEWRTNFFSFPLFCTIKCTRRWKFPSKELSQPIHLCLDHLVFQSYHRRTTMQMICEVMLVFQTITAQLWSLNCRPVLWLVETWKRNRKSEISGVPLYNSKKEDVLSFSASSEFLPEGDSFNFISTVFRR